MTLFFLGPATCQTRLRSSECRGGRHFKGTGQQGKSQFLHRPDTQWHDLFSLTPRVLHVAITAPACQQSDGKKTGVQSAWKTTSFSRSSHRTHKAACMSTQPPTSACALAKPSPAAPNSTPFPLSRVTLNHILSSSSSYIIRYIYCFPPFPASRCVKWTLRHNSSTC
jgi:hypothetical protein